jgi:hypothetical protein
MLNGSVHVSFFHATLAFCLLLGYRSLKETIASLKVELKDFVKQRVSLLADKDREIEKHEEEEVRLTKKLRYVVILIGMYCGFRYR